MDLKYIFCFVNLVSWMSLSFAQQNVNVNVVIQGETSIAKTDDNFVCTTLDWWPNDKCDKNQCLWTRAGLLDLGLGQVVLRYAVKAFNPLRIKIGGSLQDQLVYKVGGVKDCPKFTKKPGGLFGYSQGCLSTERWDQLYSFFNKTGAKITFGLNALYGRNESQTDKGLWTGDWQSQNAREFMKYTISKGHVVDSYEFGNQLSGAGVGARVDAQQYGKDIIVLKNLVKELYPDPNTQPKVLGPSGFYDEKWFNTFLEVSGKDVVDAITHEIYNLGLGEDPKLITKVQDPVSLDQVSQTYKSVSAAVTKFGPPSGAWVSESVGDLYNGAKDVTPDFVDGLWYLDQMGMAATNNHKVFCRQALVGGNNALLDVDYVPYPHYYGALLWHRLMGSTVLAATHDSKTNPNLRVYAHCSKKKPGVSLILINFSKNSFNVTVSNGATEFHGVQNREEYHLFPLGGQEQILLLNDIPLVPSPEFDICAMDPIPGIASAPISLRPHSAVYVIIRDFNAPACV